ncbi:MAG: enoyl-CoA hydratase/isomerase family protein [Sphingobacteriaceae bacterium]|nr:enoyl-CoA hydratase/isomerase family protein [Cytophagaceae bacterium]
MLFSPEQTQTFPTHVFAHLRVESNNHVLTLTLNRPEKKNALNPTLLRELAFALAHAQHNPAVWLVVLAAAGDTFCAGMDLKAMAEGQTVSAVSNLPEPAEPIRLGELMNHLTKPSIAVVQGPVWAGGFLLVAGCTWVIAAEHATFGLPEVKRGLFPFQVMDSLLRIGISPRRVLDWCLRGQTLTAWEAQELGLLSEISGKENLTATVQRLVEELLLLSPTALQAGLDAYQKLPGIPLEARQTYLFEQFQRIQQTDDAREGLSAFAEKRAAKWTGK